MRNPPYAVLPGDILKSNWNPHGLECAYKGDKLAPFRASRIEYVDNVEWGGSWIVHVARCQRCTFPDESVRRCSLPMGSTSVDLERMQNEKEIPVGA